MDIILFGNDEKFVFQVKDRLETVKMIQTCFNRILPHIVLGEMLVTKVTCSFLIEIFIDPEIQFSYSHVFVMQSNGKSHR